MKPFAERLMEALSFLESIKPGYRFTIQISKPLRADGMGLEYRTAVSVVGESFQDKSLPHTFLGIKVESFDNIPEAIQLKAQEMIDAEIESRRKSVASLHEEIGKLTAKAESLVALKEKLKQ